MIRAETLTELYTVLVVGDDGIERLTEMPDGTPLIYSVSDQLDRMNDAVTVLLPHLMSVSDAVSATLVKWTHREDVWRHPG